MHAAVLMVTGAGFSTILQPNKFLLPGIYSDPKKKAAALRILAPYDPARWVSRIAPRPLLLVNGRQDPDTTAAAARNLRVAARGAQVILYTGGHDPFAAAADQMIPARVGRFLKRSLVDARASTQPSSGSG